MPKSKNPWILAGIIILILIAGLFWYNSQKQGIIKIGVLLPLSGATASQGQDQRNAIEMAVKQSGENVQLIFEDSKGLPEEAISALNKLLKVDNVKFIIGPTYSQEIEAVSSVINKEDAIMINFGSITSPFSRFGKNQFAVSPTFAPETYRMLELIKEKKVKNLAFLGANTIAGQNIKDILEKESQNARFNLSVDLIDLKEKDFRATLLKIKSSNADTLYIWHLPSSIGMIIKQAKEIGIEMPILTFKNIEDPSALAVGGEAVNGVIYTAPKNTPQRIKFFNDFEKQYYKKPNLFSDSAYDATTLLIHAIKINGQSPEKVRKYLSGLKDYSGASGFLVFDENKDVYQEFIIKTVEGGKFVEVN